MDSSAEMVYVLMNSPREVIKLVELNIFLFFRILEPSGSACDKHSDCLPSTLCANNKCVTTQRVGSFAICDKDQDCLQGSTGSSKETCAKYKTSDQKSGVCLLPTSDPSLIVTPIPYSTTRSYNMTTTRGKIIV
ncbi:unnamed protein product [Meloidogyne enterolobii]|uniref:Uncharacterized protein n=1 Tax=Meloidogyne enterolobii TaxID=390850 RepID=A0ACB0XRR8_MELEN